MQMILREVEQAAHLEQHLALDALTQRLPHDLLAEVLTQHQAHEQRRRKLPAQVTLLLCLALALFAQESIPAVYRHLVHGLHWVWPGSLTVTPGALCQARYRLGAQPLVSLFHRLSQPLTTPQTPEAFYQGLRLVAADGSKLDVPDSPANARAFGYPGVAKGQAPWPQVLVVGLVECASHALLDVGVWPVQSNEHAAAQRLLRRVASASLVLDDAGLHSIDVVAKVQQRGAHFLGRLPGHVRPPAAAGGGRRQHPGHPPAQQQVRHGCARPAAPDPLPPR